MNSERYQRIVRRLYGTFLHYQYIEVELAGDIIVWIKNDYCCKTDITKCWPEAKTFYRRYVVNQHD